MLTAKASDSAGNAATSDGVPVKVGPEPVDAAAPVVAITRPLAGVVPRSVLVSADASEDVGVVSVALEVDKTVIRQLSTMPWSATIELSEGAHALVAIASDASGKTARSAKVDVVARAAGADGGSVSEVPDGPVKGSCGCGGVGTAPMMFGLAVLGLLQRRRPRA